MIAEARKIILRLDLKHKTKLLLFLRSGPIIKLISARKKNVIPIDTKNYHNKINKIYELIQLKSRHTEV